MKIRKNKMIITIRHEKLSDGSIIPTFMLMNANSHIVLHPIDDEKCSKLVDALYNLTTDVTEIIDYRWMKM